MADEKKTIPIFPLHTVLYPGGALPLRIFEPRYLDMVGQCLKNETGFGICLISEGKETGEVAESYETGTFGTISYWQQLPDGLLGITVRGQQRFNVLSREITADRLCMAEVELLPAEQKCELPGQYQDMAEMVDSMLEQIGHPYTTLPKHFDDAGWVSYRMAELLPLSLEQKQHFLQLTDPLERLQRLRAILVDME